MASLFRQQLETWVGNIEIKADKVLDVGGGQKPIQGRVKSWEVEHLKVLDHDSQYNPDIFADINYPINFESDLTKIKNSDLAYIAGIVDGEGCFSITDGGGRKFSASFGINMADPSGLRVFEDVLGYKITNFIASDGKPYFKIQIGGNILKKFILLIYPYLKVKRREAELALKMRESIDSTKGRQRAPVQGGGSQPLSEDIIGSRKKLLKESKDIKAGKYRNFDAIFCLEVAEYVWSPVTFHKNLWYLLKPDGIAYISYPTIYPLHNPVGIDYLRYSKHAIEKLLATSGFETWEITPRVATDGIPYLNNFWSAERMRPRRDTPDVYDIGYLVKAFKKGSQNE